MGLVNERGVIWLQSTKSSWLETADEIRSCVTCLQAFVVRSVRVDASDLSATEPFGNQYEDFLASHYRLFGTALFDRVPSSSPSVLNRSDCGQNKSGRRVPTAHFAVVRSTSFFGSNKANKRNAP